MSQYTNARISYVTASICLVISTLSLHDALPISAGSRSRRTRRHVRYGCLAARCDAAMVRPRTGCRPADSGSGRLRSEEHTSELQSHVNLVCRLLLEKKNVIPYQVNINQFPYGLC